MELQPVGSSYKRMKEDHGTFSDAPVISTTESSVDHANFTVEDAVETIGFGKFQLKLFVLCGIFTASDAMEMLLLAVLGPVLRCEWLLEEVQVAFITTAVFIGMFLGAPGWGKCGDTYGRWPMLLLVGLWISFFGFLSSFSPVYGWILVLRALVGFGIGGASQAFTILAEYLPRKHRAKTLIIYHIFWATGSCFEIILAMAVVPTKGWRWLAALSAIPLGVSCFFFYFIPESARYLMAAGDREKAMKILREAAKLNNAELPSGELQKSPVLARGKFADIFSAEYRRTTFQIWPIWFGIAFSYYGIILASSEILEFHKSCTGSGTEVIQTEQGCHCNPLGHADYITMIWSSLGEFLGLPINLFLMDLIGRQKTLAVSLVGTGVFFLLIQLCVSRGVLTFFLFGARALSSAVFNTVYIYTTEVYPTTVRALGLGSSSAMARLGAMSTPFISQVLLNASLVSALWVYGAIAFLCAIDALLLPIETRGRAMAQST
ncbi:putative transporter SVOPL [Lingula anatina]|uniref:Transporter SVOPL n=1 Tax=Lingula anatina TaxID=7574 RepID=A0A1S3JRU4_LINAN|nr:putative transporter SVOPL [Lingula anatina]|eukprot:XP_013412719.1 putative transporter SVOPL [Lingula anatina]